MVQQDNKRGSDRISQRLRGELIHPETGDSLSVWIEDISAGGMRVRMDERDFVQRDDQVTIYFEFVMLHDEEEEIEIEGIVRNVRLDDTGETLLGIQVQDDDEAHQKLLETWLTLKFEKQRRG